MVLTEDTSLSMLNIHIIYFYHYTDTNTLQYFLQYYTGTCEMKVKYIFILPIDHLLLRKLMKHHHV
jgi:hypothetical protein